MILVDGSIERVKEEMKKVKEEINSPFYMVTKTIPVKVENIVINHLLYNSFVKKLKGFKTSTLIQDNKLIMQYWKPGTSYQGKGSLVLYDISQYYEGFEHIPTGVIVNGA